MLEIPIDVIVHKLNVDSKHKLMQQKKMSFTPKRPNAIDEEVDKLLKAKFIREA